MSSLSRDNLSSRRRFDFRVVMRMSNATYEFTAHRTTEDAESGEHIIDSEEDARFAIHYRCVYHIPTLVEAGTYSEATIIRVDASQATYPFSAPSAWVVEKEGSKIPWSPHFARGVPVCHGSVWKSDGHVLLGHYLIHLARLLNWDEYLSAGYSGYNGEAIRWWRHNINKPLNPELCYPSLPVDELYGDVVVTTPGGFRPSRSDGQTTGGFQAR